MKIDELTIEVTRRCLNRCPHCSSRAVADPGADCLPAATVLRLVEEAQALGLRSLALSGGEPFLHPEIWAILSVLARLGIPAVTVYTSGVVLGPDGGPSALRLPDPVARPLARARVALAFGIHSLDPAVHDGLAGAPGRLSLALDALGAARAQGVSVEANVVPTRANAATLAETVRGLGALGAQQVSLLRFVPQGYGAGNRAALELEGGDLSEAVGSLWEERPGLVRLGAPFGGGPCRAGRSRLAVRWDGEAVPCEALKEREGARLGSVHDRSLREILDAAARWWQGAGQEACPAQRAQAAQATA